MVVQKRAVSHYLYPSSKLPVLTHEYIEGLSSVLLLPTLLFGTCQVYYSVRRQKGRPFWLAAGLCSLLHFGLNLFGHVLTAAIQVANDEPELAANNY